MFSLTLLTAKEEDWTEPSVRGSGVPASITAIPKGPNDRKLRVLLVDDNAMNRRIISLFLLPLAYEIVEAKNGQEALEALEAETFDIVLLDVHMPIMDGKETIRRIRAGRPEWKQLPVIALTADAMEGDRERYIALGMSEYVSKPIDQRELLAKLANLLAPASETPDALAS